MPKATEFPREKPRPVDTEEVIREQGLDPYSQGDSRGPVDVPISGGIAQPVPKSRFPAPEVEVECLSRGVKDRGFTFGRGGQWLTTRARAEELAPDIKIIREL